MFDSNTQNIIEMQWHNVINLIEITTICQMSDSDKTIIVIAGIYLEEIIKLS
jgi:hypothetical protein